MKFTNKYTFPLAFALIVALFPAATLTAQTAAKPAAAKAPAKKAVAAKPKAASLAASIIWRGDRATERAFVADMAKAYELAKLGRVTLQPFSTISGIDAVHDDTADIGGSARPAMPGRTEEQNLTFTPVAWEALVAITSPKNPASDITLKQLYDLYLGNIKNWKDLGGPDQEINLYAIAAPLDGVEYSARQLIYKKGDQAVAVPRVYLNTVRLEEGVTIDPQSLGFTTLSAAYANKGVKMLKVEGVAPSSTTIADGTYPLYVPLYLVSRSDGKHHEAVEKFLQYATSPAGKAIIRKHQLVPYDDAPTLVANQDSHIAWVTAHVAGVDSKPTSAPQATADYLVRTQPNSIEAQQAKQHAADVKAAKSTASQGN